MQDSCVHVWIAGPRGPNRLTGLAFDPLRPRAVVLSREGQRAPEWSAAYARFADPSGPLMRLLHRSGPDGAFVLRARQDIDKDDRTWQAAVACAHVLHARGIGLKSDFSRGDLVLWTGGAVMQAAGRPTSAMPLAPLDNPVSFAQANLRDLQAAAEQGARLLICLPGGPRCQEAAALFRRALPAARHRIQICLTLGDILDQIQIAPIIEAANGEAAPDAARPFAAPRVKGWRRPAAVLASIVAAGSAGAFAAAMAGPQLAVLAGLAALRADALPVITAPGPVALATLATIVDPQDFPADPDPVDIVRPPARPGFDNPVQVATRIESLEPAFATREEPAQVSLTPSGATAPSVTLVELKPQPGGTCHAVMHGDAEPRRMTRAFEPGEAGLVTRLSATCGIEYIPSAGASISVDPALKNASVRPAFAPVPLAGRLTLYFADEPARRNALAANYSIELQGPGGGVQKLRHRFVVD